MPNQRSICPIFFIAYLRNAMDNIFKTLSNTLSTIGPHHQSFKTKYRLTGSTSFIYWQLLVQTSTKNKKNCDRCALVLPQKNLVSGVRAQTQLPHRRTLSSFLQCFDILTSRQIKFCESAVTKVLILSETWQSKATEQLH